MPTDEGLSWKEQLGRLRTQVSELEKQREIRKRLQRERSEQSLKERLKEDTPEALNARFKGLRERFDHAVRKLYPLVGLEPLVTEVDDMHDLLAYFGEGVKQYPNAFSPNHKTLIPVLVGGLEELKGGIQKQIQQWHEVRGVVEPLTFRARTAKDDPALVAVAKLFSERAHGIHLSIPGDFFAHEQANFWAADLAGEAIGHVKYWPDAKVVSFAFTAPSKVNFNKFIRGALHRFFTSGPLPEPMDAVRVRITYGREVKFFTDLGFVRKEIRGPSDWIYQRDVN